MKIAMVTFGLAAALGGCSCAGSKGEGHSPIEVSPDGRWIAYVLETYRVVGAGPEPYTTRQEVYICWSSTATPEKVRTTKIAEWGRDKSGYSLSGQTHFLFSPGGTRIAIVYPEGLMFVNVTTGDCRRSEREKGETVSSLAWLDEETIGYVCFVERRQGQGVRMERTVWRQRFDEATSQRTVIRRDADVRHQVQKLLYGVDGWPQEFWSPDGRYVVLRGADEQAQGHLLDVTARNLRKLTGRGSLERATWSRDSRKVLWYARTDVAGRHEAFLHSIPRGDTVELSEKFRELFGTKDPGFEALWTPDNRFIVGSNLELGGYLVQVNPWEPRLIGRKLRKPGDTVPPYLRGQGVPGVLVVFFAPDEALVDYNGRVLKELGDGGMSGWSVLPGGKEAVSVGVGNKIRRIRIEVKQD